MRLRFLLLLPLLQFLLILFPERLCSQSDSNDDTLTVSRVWLAKGLESYKREKYDSSIYWYDKIASFDTNYSTALYEKALSNFKLEKYDNTILLCSKADSMNKSDEILYKILIARTHQKKGNISEAYKINYTLKNKYPYYAGLYTEKAHLAMEEGDWNEALIQLDSAFKLNPQFHTTHLYFSELAYLSGQPALAILAAHYGSLSLSNPADQYQLVQILNLEADDNYSSDYKVPQNLLGEFPEMEEINQLVKSKVCYTKNYKLKLKLDEKYIRQLQIIIENLATTELNQHDSLSNYYLDFYKTVGTTNMFEGCILYGLDAMKSAPAVANLLLLKRSNIEYFSKWLNGEVQKMIGKNFVQKFGFGENFRFGFYTNGQLSNCGLVENDKRTGDWQFYYDNGMPRARGNFDSEGNKTGEWKYYYNSGELSSIDNHTSNDNTYRSEIYYKNGNIKEKSSKVRGVVDGSFTDYHPNGSVSREINVEKGKISGKFKRYSYVGNLSFEREFNKDGSGDPFTEYYSNGNIEQTGIVVNDKFSGIINRYYPDGKMKEAANYENDKRTGWSVTYYRNGNVKDSSYYSNGKINGTKASYTIDGKLSARLAYKNGKINGLSVWYDDVDGLEYARLMFKKERLSSYEFFNKKGESIFTREEKSGAIEWIRHTPYGNVTEKGTYKKGEFDGDFETYHPDGSIRKKYKYKNGKLTGKFVQYQPTGEIYTEINYDKEGNRNGLQKEYFRNGKVKSTGYYKEGKREGLFTFYFFSGGISQEDWYEKGELKISKNYAKDGRLKSYQKYEEGYLYEEFYFAENGEISDHLIMNAGSQELELREGHQFAIAKGIMKNGGKDGIWKYYRGKDAVSGESEYVNGILSGTRKLYHSTGKIQSLEYFVNGSKDSIAFYYNELGQIESEKNYNLDEEQGIEKYYYADGKLQTTYLNREDLLNGKSIMYAPDGTIMIERLFFLGELVSYSGFNENGEMITVPFTSQTGEMKTYYSNGQLAVHISMKNGIRTGIYKLFDTDGKMLFESNYVNGYLNGKLIDYYPGGVVLEESDYVDGSLTGIQKMYYPSGKLAYSETYINSELNGPAEYFNEQGELIKKVEYQNGYEKN